MKKEEQYERNMMNFAIKLVAHTLKWLFLIAAVVSASLVIALGVVAILRNKTLTDNHLYDFITLVTRYDITEIDALVKANGILKVITGSLAIGLSKVINYIVLYVLTSNFLIVFKSIADGSIYTKENIKIIDDSLPLSVIITLSQPVIVFVTSFATGMYTAADIDMSGLGILMAVYILRIMFIEGYSISVKGAKASKELSAQKAIIEEAKMEAIKQKAEKKEAAKKAKATKTTKAKTTKTTTTKKTSKS